MLLHSKRQHFGLLNLLFSVIHQDVIGTILYKGFFWQILTCGLPITLNKKKTRKLFFNLFPILKLNVIRDLIYSKTTPTIQF